MTTIRDEVEAFLDGDRRHTLPFVGVWGAGNRVGQFRMKLPILADGETGSFELVMVISPDSDTPGLRIVLMYGTAIWRLCMDPEFHPNGLVRPADLPGYVHGPHHHSWPDNRMTGNPSMLPKSLPNARILPPHITSNDLAFEWFIEQTKILPPDWELPVWPTRTRLL